MDMTQLLIQLAAGAVGGNIGGAVLKNYSLGTVGNSVAGIVGGGLGGMVLNSMGGGGLDSVIGQIVGGGVGGTILMVVVGLVKSAMAKKA